MEDFIQEAENTGPLTLIHNRSRYQFQLARLDGKCKCQEFIRALGRSINANQGTHSEDQGSVAEPVKKGCLARRDEQEVCGAKTCAAISSDFKAKNATDSQGSRMASSSCVNVENHTRYADVRASKGHTLRNPPAVRKNMAPHHYPYTLK